jgi:hypothetical protein
MNWSQRLRDGYENSWPVLNSALVSAGSPEELSYPLLIDVEADNYAKADKRLLIVGQQTHGWYGQWCDLENDSKRDPVPFLMNLYKDFNLGTGWRHTPFWSASHDLYRALNPSGPEDGFIWSNLIKMDGRGRAESGDPRPKQELEELVCRTFNMLPMEIEIAAPEVVIFLTGPDYDRRLNDCLDSRMQPLKGWGLNELARVVDARGLLPSHSYRTYHPGYLFRGKRDVWQRIREEISTVCRG